MTKDILRIDGSLYNINEIQDLLNDRKEPAVFINMIENWPARKWSLNKFTKLFGDVQTRFKLYYRKGYEPLEKKTRKWDDSVTMETDCYYVDATFSDFDVWLKGMKSNTELDCYPSDKYWCYADYNYMVELFQNQSETLNAVDWSNFGFKSRNGKESTLWIGTEESYTPCHQDSYGFNLIAQISGVKRWIVFPPHEADLLKSTRIPYEESSVFATVNVKKKEILENAYEVELKESEVLYLPKHWWHYVECVTESISINTWVELDSDKDDRIRESLVQFLVYTIKKSENLPNFLWLNPKQELPPSVDACLELIRNSFQDKMGSVPQLNLDVLVNCLTKPSVVDAISKSIMEYLEVSGELVEGRK